MKWYEVKEQAAGEKRLLLLWYIYKILGKNVVKFIVVFVVFFALFGAKKIKEASKKYLKIVGIKSNYLNVYKHCLSYAYSLVDRMEIFSDNFSPEKIEFANENDRVQLFEDLVKGQGIFFICNHIGNVDVIACHRSGESADGIGNISVEHGNSAGLGADTHITGGEIYGVDNITVFQVVHNLLYGHLCAIILGLLGGCA